MKNNTQKGFISPFDGASGLVQGPAPAFSSDKPNVLFLVVDDMRPEINAMGASYMHTPAMDRLARGSLVLERNYVQQALCGPTRASFMVSRRPDSTRTVTHGMKCPGSRGSSCYWRDVAGNFTTIPQVHVAWIHSFIVFSTLV